MEVGTSFCAVEFCDSCGFCFQMALLEDSWILISSFYAWVGMWRLQRLVVVPWKGHKCPVTS